jgi:hypothetical protein
MKTSLYKTQLIIGASQVGIEPFSNDGKEQARDAISTIFDLSTKVVQMWSGALNKIIYDSDMVLNSIVSFLNRGGRLQIILDSYNDSSDSDNSSKTSSKLLSELFFFQKKDTLLGYDSEDKRSIVIKKVLKNQAYHYEIGDGAIYRDEYNPTEFQATIEFHNHRRAKELCQEFNSLFNNLEEYKIVETEGKFRLKESKLLSSSSHSLEKQIEAQ